MRYVHTKARGLRTRYLMPRILRLDGARVAIYPKDHLPEHVHVISAENEAVLELHCPDGPIVPRANYGFGKRHLNRLMEGFTENLATLCVAWDRIHEAQ